MGRKISIIRRQHISSLSLVLFLFCFPFSFLSNFVPFSPPHWVSYVLCVCVVFRLTVEHASRESEKLRSDLQEANQRSSLLAQEVDENHAKQESIRRTQFKYKLSHFLVYFDETQIKS